MKRERVTVLMPEKIKAELKSYCDKECLTVTDAIMKSVKNMLKGKQELPEKLKSGEIISLDILANRQHEIIDYLRRNK